MNSPSGWELALLSELIGAGGLFSDGNWVISKDQDPNGTIRLLQLADIGDGMFLDRSERFINEVKFVELECTEVKAGDVLIARMPDPLGRACLMPKSLQKCITVVDVAILRPGVDSISTKWLMHFINSPSIRQKIALQASGTTRQRISRKNLGNIELPVPPSKEQERISEKLDTLFTRVAACQERLDRVQLLLEQFRQSVLAHATSGVLTEDWDIERESWQLRSLGSVLTDIRYGTSKKSSYDFAEGTPVLRIPNIRDNRIDDSDLKYGSFNERELENLALKQGDLLIIRSNGSLDLVGNAAVVEAENEDYLFAGYLIRLRVNPAIINPNYLALCLSSPKTRKYIETTARSTNGINNINSKEIQAIQLELPTIEEQEEIIQRVNILFSSIARLEPYILNARSLIEYLTPGLLDNAFRGELVPQDADDEPASVLLERIHEARANALDQQKKPRRRSKMADLERKRRKKLNLLAYIKP